MPVPNQNQEFNPWLFAASPVASGIYNPEGTGNFLSKFFMGTPGGYQKSGAYDPEQYQAFQQFLQGGLRDYNNPYEGWAPIEQNAREQFNTQYIPGLLERFTAGYNNSNRGSGALAGALGSAGTGLESLLAAQRSEYGMQNKQQALQAAQFGGQPRNEYIEGTEGALSQILPLLAEAAVLYASGGTTGAQGIADIFGKGVNAFKNLGGNSKKKPTVPNVPTPPKNFTQGYSGINGPTTGDTSGWANTSLQGPLTTGDYLSSPDWGKILTYARGR
jgi:hypothetical protein